MRSLFNIWRLGRYLLYEAQVFFLKVRSFFLFEGEVVIFYLKVRSLFFGKRPAAKPAAQISDKQKYLDEVLAEDSEEEY